MSKRKIIKSEIYVHLSNTNIPCLNNFKDVSKIWKIVYLSACCCCWQGTFWKIAFNITDILCPGKCSNPIKVKIPVQAPGNILNS